MVIPHTPVKKNFGHRMNNHTTPCRYGTSTDKFDIQVSCLNYSKKQWHASGITKKGQESSVKGENHEFFPLNFLNLRLLECYTSLIGM